MSLPTSSGGRVIEILVDREGNSRVETRGFAGSSCREASRFVEEALGRRTGERLTGEFYQQTSTEGHLRQSQ